MAQRGSAPMHIRITIPLTLQAAKHKMGLRVSNTFPSARPGPPAGFCCFEHIRTSSDTLVTRFIFEFPS